LEKETKKSRRRGRGEGSYRQLETGTWECRFTTGRDATTGKQLQRTVYAPTKQECTKKMREAIARYESGGYAIATKQTLGGWLEYWLWNVKKEDIKPRTFDGYLDSVEVHIRNTRLAGMKLSDVRRQHIQAWIDEKRQEGRTPRVIGYAYGIIRNALNDAVRRGLIETNPAEKVSLPKKAEKPPAIFTDRQQQIFLDAIKGHRHEALFFVALTTGLREGELAALKWTDVDLKNATLSVSRDTVCINLYDENTRERTGTTLIVQDTPKSSAGIRTIPLLPETADALRLHRQRQLEEKMKNRLLYQDNDLVFCNETGGLYNPRAFYTAFRRICKNTPGLEPIKFHALRHTFATRGLEAEMSGKAVQALLGHETEAMTRHYQHLVEKQARKEMDKLRGVFSTK